MFVATFASHGIRVYHTKDGAELARDEDYASHSQGAIFDRQGGLVTSCGDGMLRLYSPSFRKVATRRVPGAPGPLLCSFSPDGQSVAVGFEDTPAVNVVSGQDLSLRFAPDTSGVDRGSLGNGVTWSADGRMLYAAGRYMKVTPSSTAIVRWAEAGRGARQELPYASIHPVVDLKPLQAGGVVDGTQEPGIGRLDPHGRDQLLHGSSQADYRLNVEGFVVSADGSTVQFGYWPFGKQPARFSVPARLLQSSGPTESAMPLGFSASDKPDRSPDGRPRVNGERVDEHGQADPQWAAVTAWARRSVMELGDQS